MPIKSSEAMGVDLQVMVGLLLDSSSEGILIVDGSATITYCNTRLQELFGYDGGELLGNKVEMLIPIERTKHEKLRNGYMAHPEKKAMGSGRELAGIKKDGTKFPVEVSLNSLKDGDQVHVLAMVSDITVRKKAQDELSALNENLEKEVEARTELLHQSQLLYKAISRNFPNGTINVFDRNLCYIFAEGEELFRMGIRETDLIGSSYLEKLPAENRDEIEAKLKSVFLGDNKSFEIEIKKGTYQLNCVGLRGTDGSIDQILVVEQNISKQKQIEHEMQESLEKERQLNELKSRFVAMASHEFRTPLAAIASSVSLIEKYTTEEQNPKRLKHTGRVKKSVKHLIGILNDILSLSKLEEGKVEMRPEQLHLKDLIQSLTENLEPLLKKGQHFELTCEGDDTFVGDEKMTNQIVTNLMSNAVKYSGDGNAIDINVVGTENEISMTVQDHGIGIPPEDQERLFQRFFRAENVTNIEGTGLGLNIVKKYVEMQGGKITFESVVEEGTSFTVTFPK